MNHKHSYRTSKNLQASTSTHTTDFMNTSLQKYTLEDLGREIQKVEDQFEDYEEIQSPIQLRAPSSGYYTHKPLIVVNEPILDIESQYEESFTSNFGRRAFQQSIPVDYLKQKRKLQQKAEEQKQMYKQQVKYLNSCNHSCNWCL